MSQYLTLWDALRSEEKAVNEAFASSIAVALDAVKNDIRELEWANSNVKIRFEAEQVHKAA